MNFFVVAKQQRFRVKRKEGREVAYLFREKPICKVFKEEFATRGGAEVFRDMLAKAQAFRHRLEIPGRTLYQVVPAATVLHGGDDE